MIKVIDSKDKEAYIEELFARNQSDYDTVYEIVDDIIKNVSMRGDEALIEYTEKFDGVKLDNLEVSEAEIESAFQSIDASLLNTLEEACNNIQEYHSLQIQKSVINEKDNGEIQLGRLVTPIESVGIYVPGGKALYPSTVLMNAVPAKIAGVENIVMVTPPQKDGTIKDTILVAAKLAGVNKIYKLGGAQAVAALAYGTSTVDSVSKITGPGNIYVAAAKRKVQGIVGIDMIAGPSEILIVADEKANPKYIAADLMGQAEHDEMAASILITNSSELAEQVIMQIDLQIDNLSKKEIIDASLSNYGAIIVVDDMDEAFDLANIIAAEHLEILTTNPFEDYKKIKNAGAIFLGEYTPEPVGDYYAGPNHTLPTSGTAKFSSPLSVEDFVKKTSLIYYSQEALSKAKDNIIEFATDEELTAHANAVRIRFES